MAEGKVAGLSPGEFATQVGVIIAGGYAGWQKFQKWRGENEKRADEAKRADAGSKPEVAGEPRPDPCEDERRIIVTLRAENERLCKTEEEANQRADRAEARLRNTQEWIETWFKRTQVSQEGRLEGPTDVPLREGQMTEEAMRERRDGPPA